jgi:hypothetical protein
MKQMNTVSLGTKKKQYRSIRLAAEAANIPYMTLYMRLRAGMPLSKAAKLPVRAYRKNSTLAS